MRECLLVIGICLCMALAGSLFAWAMGWGRIFPVGFVGGFLITYFIQGRPLRDGF